MKRAGPSISTIDQWLAANEEHAQPLAQSLTECTDAHFDDDAEQDLVQILQLLTELRADEPCLLAAVQYWQAYHGGDDAECGKSSVDNTGADVLEVATNICAELLEIDRLENAFVSEKAVSQAEGLRRLLLALVKDVRVLLVVLSDRLVQLRKAVDAEPEAQQALARRIASIHVPLANRLGIWQLKWELEDLVFRFLQPDVYKQIAQLLDERRADRERYIGAFVARVEEALGNANIEGDVKGRPKHIFSIWKKMQRKGLEFNELFDVRAVRIMVHDVATCYAALGLIHTLWRPIPGEFDDYVANPKGNMYQSLHTAVFGPEGKPVEVQIRTFEMHEHAELGVAAHWRYKEGGHHDPTYQRKLNWMRQLLESGGEFDDDSLLDEFTGDTEEDRVYVLTPGGDVVDLQSGSTVLDFAYHIHTDVGHRCRGAKVNGRIVPLTYTVSNGEQVEILTSKKAAPSRDWISLRGGYLRSSRARSKVRQWYKRKDFDQNATAGKEILERDLKRLALDTRHLEGVLDRLNFKNIETLYVAIATGEVTVGQVATYLNELNPPKPNDETTIPLSPKPSHRRSKDDIVIEGVGNLLSSMAKCCSPLPGDRIVGYLTQGKGVSVHRSDCASFLNLASSRPERILDVSWESSANGQYQAEIRICAYDRPGLISDIGTVLSNARSDLLDMNTHADEAKGEKEVRVKVQVRDFDHLSQLMTRLNNIPNVTDVHRFG